MGARPLRRVIEQYLEDVLAEKLLLNPTLEKKYLIKEENNKIIFFDKEENQIEKDTDLSEAKLDN
jgi:ATP-dependent Clp protease ATP-binding subunit ClpA